MTNDIDIWRAAKIFMDQHGADANIHAAIEADKYLNKGDYEGSIVWRRILRAIESFSTVNADGSLQ